MKYAHNIALEECEQWNAKLKSNFLSYHVVEFEPNGVDQSAGYHTKPIAKGVLGEVSKIEEELEEFKDALAQDCKVMALVELSDMVGAIKAYLDKNHPELSLGDLERMAQITKRAFNSGARK
jgi:hypothetical protein